MKKILLIAIVMLLLASLTLSIYAFTASPSPSPGHANGAFQTSPSVNRAPEIVGGSSENPDCVLNEGGSVIIVPYKDRKTLPDGGALMEEAYLPIAGTDDLGTIGDEMQRLASMCMVQDSKHLKVADLFEMHHEGCDETDHKEITVQFKPKSFDKMTEYFASVIHYKDGEWVIVQSTIAEDGTITMVTDDLEGPYAIVVRYGGDGISPQNAALLAAGLAILAGVLSLILIALVFKKKRID